MYPIVVPVHSVGGGIIRPFESKLEMFANGSLLLSFTVMILGVCIYLMFDIDSILAKVLVWIVATLFITGLWGIFFMCC